MSSKRRLRRHECTRKRPLTQAEARRIAAKLTRRTGQRVNAYKCPWSGRVAHYHVGHTPKRVKQMMAAKAQAKG